MALARGKRNDIARKKWKIVIAEGDEWFYTTRRDKIALKHYKKSSLPHASDRSSVRGQEAKMA